MSEKKDKKSTIKIKTLSKKSQEEDIQASKSDTSENNCESEVTKKNSKVRTTIITAEIPSNSPKIVGQIPPWDDDEDSQQDDKSKPPTITAEIPSELEKFDLTPRITGQIPPWDDEEES